MHSWIVAASMQRRRAERPMLEQAQRSGADMGRMPLQPDRPAGGDATISSPASKTTRSAPAGRAMRVAFRAAARLAALALMASLGYVAVVSAEDKPAANVLRIAAADSS